VISVKTGIQYVRVKNALQSEKLDMQIGELSQITKKMTASEKAKSMTARGTISLLIARRWHVVLDTLS
jgi:hypothetical protein